MNTHYFFVEPVDVLMLRGNGSFGDAGQHGEALMPPWPSVFAGAFRSALLAGDARRLAEFVSVGSSKFDRDDHRSERMRSVLGSELFATLGTPQHPGTFRINWASLARRVEASVHAALPLPADLVVHQDGDIADLEALVPTSPRAGLRGSANLPMNALLRAARQVKPSGGHWLDGDGLAAHLQGRIPMGTLRTEALYRRETRLGIELHARARTASEGALYTTEAVSLTDKAGFLVGVEGAAGLAAAGRLRLGGDGRGARWQRVSFAPPAAAAIARGGRFRMLLVTPGIFSGGWLPERVTRTADGSYRLQGEGFSARLACAAVPRHEVVSGWDLAQWAPKTAQRVASAGSVYWFDQFEGDSGKLAEWVAAGLWPDNGVMPPETAQRRAEGFNNALLGVWN